MDVKLGRYRHYKGEEVRVLGVSKHSETLEDLVIYEAPANSVSKLWARPLGMFFEEVEVEGQKVPRFTYLEET